MTGESAARDRILLNGHLNDALVDGHPTNLTPREFQLLAHLMSRPSQIVPKDDLLAAIWGSPGVGDGHAVEVYVSRVRSKLSPRLQASEVIRTVRGRGFMFVPPPAQSQTFRMVNDARLILREIEPDDQPLLGWQPADILDTFFILTPQPWLYDHPNVARTLASALVLAGVRDITGPFALRTADGGIHVTDGHATLHSRARRFVKLESVVYL
jgi:DNA-binding winged helix-turn-helix (wHTH) protein